MVLSPVANESLREKIYIAIITYFNDIYQIKGGIKHRCYFSLTVWFWQIAKAPWPRQNCEMIQGIYTWKTFMLLLKVMWNGAFWWQWNLSMLERIISRCNLRPGLPACWLIRTICILLYIEKENQRLIKKKTLKGLTLPVELYVSPHHARQHIHPPWNWPWINARYFSSWIFILTIRDKP